MKDITMKIVGKHIRDDVEDEDMELITEGKLYKKNNAIYLTYSEEYFSDAAGGMTRLRLEGDTVKLYRPNKGEAFDTVMYFQKGKRCEAVYDTPMGPLELEILANEVRNNVKEDGTGSLYIDYDISLKGLSQGHSKLSIELL